MTRHARDMGSPWLSQIEPGLVRTMFQRPTQSTTVHVPCITLHILRTAPNNLDKHWSSKVQANSGVTTWDTGVPADVLKYVGARSVTVHEDFVRNGQISCLTLF